MDNGLFGNILGNAQSQVNDTVDRLTTFSLSQPTINSLGLWLMGGFVAATVIGAVVQVLLQNALSKN